MGIKQNYLYRVMPGSPRTARSPSPAAAGTYGNVTSHSARRHRAPRDRLASQPRAMGESYQTSPSSLDGVPLTDSSATVLSIRSCEKSGTSSPSTISHSPSEQRHGNEEMIPSSTP